MKAIILIQSIIILLGAYYVYTMNHRVSVVTEPPIVEIAPMKVPDTLEEYTPPTGNPPADETSVESSATIKGPNDAGMEYPIMDSTVEVQ